MDKVITWVKSHPLLAGGLFLGVLALWYLLRSSGGSQQTTTVSGGHSEGFLIQQGQIAAQLQGLQITTGAQLQAKQLDANTAITQQAGQIAAQLQLAEINKDTNLAGINAQRDIAIQTLQEQQNEKVSNNHLLETQLTTQAQVLSDNIDAAKEEALSRDNLFVHSIDSAAATQQLQISTAGMIAEHTLQNQQDIAHLVLTNPEFGHNYGGSATGVTQILSALNGQGPEALASTNPGAYGGAGSSFLEGLGKGLANVATGLF